MTTPYGDQKPTRPAIKPLTGEWWTRCCVCGNEYHKGVGSTPCCGSVQEIIRHIPGSGNTE